MSGAFPPDVFAGQRFAVVGLGRNGLPVARALLAMGADVVAVERALENHVPVEFQGLSHHWLILHGRYTCLARKPRCPACLIADICTYQDKTPP